MPNQEVLSVLDLPISTLVTLSTGYLGYRIAYFGILSSQKVTDITFKTLLFGLIGGSIYRLLIRTDNESTYLIVLAIALSFFASFAVAFICRKFLFPNIDYIFRRLTISYTNDSTEEWSEISKSYNYSISQIVVHLKNGVTLYCEDTYDYQNCINGPCVLGGKKDILMYVTHYKQEGGVKKEVKYLKDSNWGDKITYIPTESILYTEIRRRPLGKKQKQNVSFLS